MMHADMQDPPQSQLDSAPSSTTNLTPSTAIQMIDQQIAHYKRVIIGLRVQRNSHQPISQLPVEVLCRIFALAQQSLTAGQHYCPSKPHPPNTSQNVSRQELSWIGSLTHVCHYWRNAALNEPSLWTRPPLHFKKWTSAFLERSQMAGVTWSFCCEESVMSHTATVVSHIPRTTTLVFEGIPRAALDEMFNRISLTTAPVLEALTIHGECDSDGFALQAQTSLPGATLRHLSLSCVKIPWNSHLLYGLIDLRLDNIPLTARPTPAEFLMVLQQNPALRSLTLNNFALPAENSLKASAHADRRRVRLPCLETLNVSSEERVCEFVFNHILLSDRIRKISADVEYNDDSDSSRHVHRLLSAIQKAYVGPPLGLPSRSAYIGRELPYNDEYYTLKSFVLATRGHTSVHGDTPFGLDDSLTGEPGQGIPLDSSFQPNPGPVGALDLQLSGGHSSRTKKVITRIREVADFIHGIRWDNVAQLDMSSLRCDDVNEPHASCALITFVATTLRTALPALRAVAVGQSTAKPLIHALGKDSESDTTGTMSFPALQHISFTNVTFVAKSWQDSSGFGTVLPVDWLLACLSRRNRRTSLRGAAAVHSIAIIKCEMFRSEYGERLREVVSNVKWNTADCVCF